MVRFGLVILAVCLFWYFCPVTRSRFGHYRTTICRLGVTKVTNTVNFGYILFISVVSLALFKRHHWNVK